MAGDFDESEPTRGEQEAGTFDGVDPYPSGKAPWDGDAAIPFALTNADVLKLWERTKASEAAANEAYVLAHRQARREIVAEAVEACVEAIRALPHEWVGGEHFVSRLDALAAVRRVKP